MTDIAITRLIEMFLLPPAGPLIIAVLGLLLSRMGKTIGTLLTGISLLVLYLAATPLMANLLLQGLEPKPRLTETVIKNSNAQAIVVIAGPDGYYSAPEYGRDTAGPGMLMRLRYAATLQHKTNLPLAVIGGDPLGRGVPAAEYMKRILRQEFNTPVLWTNGESMHTFDNARYASEALKRNGIKRIYLVTHAWHMRRARLAFENQGLTVVPAPTAFTTESQLGKNFFALIPRAEAMQLTNLAIHEWIGIAWFELFITKQ